MQKTVIMTIGMNLSGKSSFADCCKIAIPELIKIENDDRVRFVKQYYPAVEEKMKNNHDFNENNVNMRVFGQKSLATYILNAGFSIVLSNCNTYKNARKHFIDYYQSLGCKVIGVYFDIPFHVLHERALICKQKECTHSYPSGILGNLEWMQSVFEKPSPDEFDHFEVVTPQDTIGFERVIDNILAYIHSI